MNNPHLTPWGILFYLLAQSLNSNNQLPLLRIDDDWLTGSKVENFQPAAFNGHNGRERGDEIYYCFNDQLGTPQELVTAQVEIVWSAVYKSYGNLAIDYQTVPQPQRLPGQYFDEESGLHYNRHRYYDPHCARYISQDPIGLAGGKCL